MEAGIQISADTINHGDDRDRNTCCDSIAVAAETSLVKRVNKFFMGIPWTDTWLPERIPGSGRAVRL